MDICRKGVSEVLFCTTEHPQWFEFEVATCRTCRLVSKKAILEVATSNLQKWRGFAQSLGPFVPIWHPLFLRIHKILTFLKERSQSLASFKCRPLLSFNWLVCENIVLFAKYFLFDFIKLLFKSKARFVGWRTSKRG